MYNYENSVSYVLHDFAYIKKMQAIKDVHIFVAVMILVVLDVVVIVFYLLLAGLLQELGAILIPNRENPSDSIEVSWLQYKDAIQNYHIWCVLLIVILVFFYSQQGDWS